MKKIALGIMLALSGSSISVHAQSINDILDGTITLQQTDGFIGTLGNGNTHHVMGPRLNFRVPTRTINVVSFTPPSLETGCSSTNINLGNFSIISIDEAITMIRQIAAQSLNYAFGQALQSMCQPCWAGLNDLKKQLNDFNMNAKNSCQFAQSWVDTWGIDSKVEGMKSEICASKESAIGSDSLVCQAGSGVSGIYNSAAGGLTDLVRGWNTTLEASGGTVGGTFTSGNLMYELYHRVDPTNQRFENMDVFNMLFGVQAAEGIKPWQIAATFFGTSGVMTNESNTVVGKAEPLISSISNLVLFNTNRTAAEGDGLTFYTCSETPDLASPDPQCANLDQEKVVQNLGVCTATARFAADATPKPNDSFMEFLTCEVEDLLRGFASGNIFADAGTNSALRKHMLSLLSRSEQRALVYATNDEFNKVSGAITTFLAQYIYTALLHDVFNEFFQNHLAMSQIASEKIKNMNEELAKDSYKESLEAFKTELKTLRDEKDEAYRHLREFDQWNQLAKKYEKDMSEELASFMTGR